MVKNHFAFVAAVIAALTLSCSGEEENPQPVPYFTLTVGDNYTSGAFTENGNWVIVHDENGEVWDFSNYVAGQQIVFDSIATPKQLGITFLEVLSFEPKATIRTYLNITPGQEWTLKGGPLINGGTSLGTLNVEVTGSNIGHYANTQLSSPLTIDVELAQFGYKYNRPIGSNNRDLLMFVTDNNSRPLFRFFKNAVAGSNSLGIADFSPFDREISISFPPTDLFYFVARGYPQGIPVDPKLGFIASLYWDGYFTKVPRAGVKLGYLNEFTGYYVSGVATYQAGSNFTHLRYEYYGTNAPDPITLIDDFDGVVNNKTFDKYSVSGKDFSSIESRWGMNETSSGAIKRIVWAVHSTTEGQINLLQIPQTIIKKYPFIDFNTKTYLSSTFHKGTKTYDDTINEMFNGAPTKPYLILSKEFF